MILDNHLLVCSLMNADLCYEIGTYMMYVDNIYLYI